MHPVDTAEAALALTAVLAVVARLAGALSTSGALAGAIVGTCVSFGFGLPGLALLGTFFGLGSIATRIGWAQKRDRGTAEAAHGRRDWKRVLGKGGVAAAIAVIRFAGGDDWCEAAFAGALAAALADTLGTEIGTLATGRAVALPSMRTVAIGTPGAVSVLGTFAAACGALAIAALAPIVGILDPSNYRPWPLWVVAGSGLGASLLESVAVGCGLRAPGFVRNVVTTLAGAAASGLIVHRYIE